MTRMSKTRGSRIRAAIIGGLALGIAGGVASLPAQANAVPMSVEGAAHVARSGASCPNALARTLHAAGFRGVNLREAWAIAMRESTGQANLGPGHWEFNGNDWGLFQWNKPSWGGQPWWNDSKMLNGVYSARIAYRYSAGGRDWHLWGLDGRGRTAANLYSNYGWNSQQIYAWITEPFQRYYRQFAPLASRCS